MVYVREKLLCHIAMVAKFLDLSKRGPANSEKNDVYNVPVHDCSRNKTIPHTFHPLFYDADGPVCQEQLLRS